MLAASIRRPQSQQESALVAWTYHQGNSMPNQITYAHHEMDPVLMRGNEALIFIYNQWQSMCSAIAFDEAKLMTEEEFYNTFGKIADHVVPDAWAATS
jgi:hypothetical protein